jgi:hypothetical protein
MTKNHQKPTSGIVIMPKNYQKLSWFPGNSSSFWASMGGKSSGTDGRFPASFRVKRNIG